MITTSGNIVTEYGCTPAGQFFFHTKVGKGKGLFRATDDVEQFMRWMIKSELDKEWEKRRRSIRLPGWSSWWRRTAGDCIRGQFNTELYLKIIEAKEKNENRQPRG